MLSLQLFITMSSLVRVCATVFLFYACGLYGSHMTTKAADACAQALRALERKMLKRFDKLEDGVSKCCRPPPKGKWSHFSRWWEIFKTDLDEIISILSHFSHRNLCLLSGNLPKLQLSQVSQIDLGSACFLLVKLWFALEIHQKPEDTLWLQTLKTSKK